MDTSKQADRKPDEAAERGRKWSTEERDVVVRASLKKGTTVNAIARLYGVQPWQIYEWRKQARRVAEQSKAVSLLPVEVAEADQADKIEQKQSCSVVIEVESARITITGSIDAIVVRTVLECLAR
jgi:transposase-like protein